MRCCPAVVAAQVVTQSLCAPGAADGLIWVGHYGLVAFSAGVLCLCHALGVACVHTYDASLVLIVGEAGFRVIGEAACPCGIL